MKIKKLICVGDFHIPYHNIPATNLFYKFIKDCQPDWIVLLGDLLDMWELSSFRKFPALNGNSFSEELKQAKRFISDLIALSPKSKIVYIEGNHEFRLRKFLMEKARELYFLPSLHLEYLLDLHKYPQIVFYDLKNKSRFSHNFMKFGHLYIGHADMSRKEAGYTAKGLRDEFGCNIIAGHSHKIGFSPKTYKEGVLVSYESGCMCQLNPDYIAFPNWQNGWIYIESNDDFTEFNIYPILIRDYKIYFNNKVYQ